MLICDRQAKNPDSRAIFSKIGPGERVLPGRKLPGSASNGSTERFEKRYSGLEEHGAYRPGCLISEYKFCVDLMGALSKSELNRQFPN
jgi:hypothetical protein